MRLIAEVIAFKRTNKGLVGSFNKYLTIYLIDKMMEELIMCYFDTFLTVHEMCQLTNDYRKS